MCVHFRNKTDRLLISDPWWILKWVLDGCVPPRPPNVDPILERFAIKVINPVLKNKQFFDTWGAHTHIATARE